MTHPLIYLYLSVVNYTYLTSSKTTLTDYQCVSTGRCFHVARIKISIDNQSCYKTNARYDILPEQPKEKA